MENLNVIRSVKISSEEFDEKVRMSHDWNRIYLKSNTYTLNHCSVTYFYVMSLIVQCLSKSQN